MHLFGVLGEVPDEFVVDLSEVNLEEEPSTGQDEVVCSPEFVTLARRSGALEEIEHAMLISEALHHARHGSQKPAPRRRGHTRTIARRQDP